MVFYGYGSAALPDFEDQGLRFGLGQGKQVSMIMNNTTMLCIWYGLRIECMVLKMERP